MIQSGTDFARYELGELAVLALRDGYVDMPPGRLRQKGDRPFGAELPGQVRLVDGKLRLSVNAFLVIEQGRHILVDTGAGNAWHPSMGLLLRALAEAGIAREDITAVACTHTHTDHVNGLVAPDGSDAFPNLEQLFVPQEEVALFDRSERLARFRQRCVPMGNGFAVSDHMVAVAAHGHSAGHTMFAVPSGGEQLLIWGDIVHVPSIQFARPELTWELDRDQVQARSTRAQILDRAAWPGMFVAGAHLDFPGIGSVARDGDAFRFSPL
ncbi:MAG TPA: MBL fold metallo-hydrolase [Geminicoccus sp.]|uniref:MBL fold metallo-hydrolase n=1 Tax=Geminicoccus sp. TaxID=2024832 RepID=UPI002BBE532E|nr:MBL fold metallo-hydrolase [Geminicoccus sp.]HWL68906.1 MBL fold metallo-hydrolase [Geminicoccus sp.]